MLRDPFFLQIIDKLEQSLDFELFEQAVADLLRSDWPTLVPIRGGSDAGMDGGVADAEGPAFPLVTTTGKDSIGNLTRNLNSYLKDGGERRKVIFATSRSLTPLRRRNLEQRAQKLGFVLVQVYEQAAIANLLYRSPKWCKELLNLSGDPSPLSVVPKTSRPLLNQSMIGRDSDLTWLRTCGGDRLLVGQPGSGKTFLLYQLAMEGEGLFVISQDRGEIAAAVRSQQPSTLIVDDAQMYPQLIEDLKQLRVSTGADYTIVASCWPGDEASVSDRLGTSMQQIHRLNLLTRDEIVEVIKGTGLLGSVRLLQEIVDQAEGRPGLAVTLSYLCLAGGVQEVLYGDRLRDSTITSYERVIGTDLRSILAAFAIGGDRGLTKEAVAHYLDMRLVELLRILVRLAVGGVLLDVDEQRLSVRPPVLRYALIRDVFFSGALSLSLDPLLPHANPGCAAESLIGARSRGAAIPDDLLRQILYHANSTHIWNMYASLGQDEAQWVLDNFPERIRSFAEVGLHHVPAKAIPLILQAAVGDDRPLPQNPDHPLRILQKWVRSGRPGTSASLSRRRLLFDSTRSWLLEGHDVNTALRAFQICLSPEYESISSDPGSGMRSTIERGCLLREELEAVHGLWGELWESLEGLRIDNLTPVWEALEAWAFPVRISSEVPTAESEYLQESALALLETAVDLAQGQLGFLRLAARIASWIDADLEVSLPVDFSTLYPEEDRENWEESEKQQREAVSKLAVLWSQQEPETIAQRLKTIELEASRADLRWPRWTPTVCFDIANSVSSPSTWFQAFVKIGVEAELTLPFLKRAAKIDESGWTDLVVGCLDNEQLRGSAVYVILSHSGSPENVVREALLHTVAHGMNIQWMCARNEISEERVRMLLNHPDPAVARAAAAGEWHREPNESVRETLYADWRKVVIQHSLDDHLMQRVLVNDAELAYEWLNSRIDQQMPLSYGPRKDRLSAVQVAVEQIAHEDLVRLLDRIAAMEEERYFAFYELVPTIVRGKPELYERLLSDKRLKFFHLSVFAYPMSDEWIQYALLALDAGYTKEEIAGAAFPRVWSWSGDESDMWAELGERFVPLLGHADERIQAIGTLGMDYALAEKDRALYRERREGVYGRL